MYRKKLPYKDKNISVLCLLNALFMRTYKKGESKCSQGESKKQPALTCNNSL